MKITLSQLKKIIKESVDADTLANMKKSVLDYAIQSKGSVVRPADVLAHLKKNYPNATDDDCKKAMFEEAKEDKDVPEEKTEWKFKFVHEPGHYEVVSMKSFKDLKSLFDENKKELVLTFNKEKLTDQDDMNEVDGVITPIDKLESDKKEEEKK